MFIAVLCLKPHRKALSSFTCIATAATEGNIFSGNDARIVDDVFPTWCRPLGSFCRGKLVSAIDAHGISFTDFLFKPFWNVPTIRHWALFPCSVSCNLFALPFCIGQVFYFLRSYMSLSEGDCTKCQKSLALPLYSLMISVPSRV